MAGHGMRMFVAGGSGFIGSNICRESVRRGFKVVSVSRTGRPEHINEPWVDCVEWVQADIRDQPAYLEQLRKADTVFSCIGKFGLGNNSDVYETNADLNIQLAHLVKNECEGLKKYGYISAQQYSARVQAPFRSYFQSKLKAEYMIQTLFPKNYLVIRPNWVFGWRHLYGPLWLPTQLIGQPIEHFLNPIADYAENTKCVVPPLPVTELAHTAVLGMTLGRDISGTLPTKRIRDVIEREAQGRPLDDYLLPYQRQVNDDLRVYLEETNWAEKYGLRGYGKKNNEHSMIYHKQKLNNAVCQEKEVQNWMLVVVVVLSFKYSCFSSFFYIFFLPAPSPQHPSSGIVQSSPTQRSPSSISSTRT